MDQKENGKSKTKNPAVKKLKVVTKPVRKKNERNALKGYECKCCKPFYDALGLSNKEKKKLVQLTSRHRNSHTPPTTPPRYWNTNF